VGNRLLCGLLHRISRWLAIDWDLTLNRSTRGFRGGDLLEAIRRQPTTPLLAVLRRRIRRFEAGRLDRRVQMGEELSGLLDVHVSCPGNDSAKRTYWVFPVLSVAEPETLIARLRQAGFDATQGHSLCVVEPPPWQRDMRLSGARQLLLWVVFLPFYPEISPRAVRKMARIVNDFTREAIEASE
jgi:dTDP-4-amino-4,6-dideoxygalactose transaminase